MELKLKINSTPLHYCALCGLTDIAKVLLEFECTDVNIKNNIKY